MLLHSIVGGARHIMMQKKQYENALMNVTETKKTFFDLPVNWDGAPCVRCTQDYCFYGQGNIVLPIPRRTNSFCEHYSPDIQCNVSECPHRYDNWKLFMAKERVNMMRMLRDYAQREMLFGNRNK